jgi:pentatricopeptide repeat protein
MREKGIAPNEVTFICALKACGSIERLTMGEEIHAEVRRGGLLAEGSNPMLGNAVLDMYAKCGMMSKARQVFEELCTRDVVSWNALVTGYSHQGLAEEALQCFEQMQDEGIVPNEVTFIAILKASASVECLEIGERIHSKVRRNAGLLAREISLGVSLVDMYAKCGEMGKALEAFRELPVPSGAACNALISGYVQNGFSEEALSLFHDMRDEPIAPDAVTFSCVLKACANVGALEVGREIHDEVRQRGLVEKDIVLRTALADMYAKCGAFERAQEIFKAFPGGDIVSWNVIMAMYAQLGHTQQAFRLFGWMMAASVDITQDVIVFLLLLTVCSHAGLDKEARLVFERMSTTYCLTPTLDHYTCMIDLFGRAGQLSRAIAILEQAPPSRGDRVPLLLALMSACYKWFNVELGEWTFKQLIKLDEKCEAAYVCMGNIYAVAGMHSETEKLDALRLQNDVVYRVPRDLLVD